MCLIHMTWNTWLQNLHKYFHLWKMPLPRTLQTPLGRIKEALSLRRCSVVLQLILLPVAMMLSEQSRRIKRELTSWMINEGKCSNSWTTTILLKPYRAHTPARRSCAVILGLFSLLISCLISRKHVRNFLAVALVLPAVQSQCHSYPFWQNRDILQQAILFLSSSPSLSLPYRQYPFLCCAPFTLVKSSLFHYVENSNMYASVKWITLVA